MKSDNDKKKSYKWKRITEDGREKYIIIKEDIDDEQRREKERTDSETKDNTTTQGG